MANYRQIHVSIWKDTWFLDLEPDEKLLFIYLFSNESSSLSGMYRLSTKVICFETGIDKARMAEILAKFKAAGKVHHDGDIIWIVNMRKFHETTSYKVQQHINNDIASIPDCELKRKYIAYQQANIPYPYPMDTQPPKEEEEDKKNRKINLTKEEEKAATAKLFQSYQGNIGAITKTASEDITSLLKDYSVDWISETFEIAARQNKRSLAYCEAILKRWEREGKDDGKQKVANDLKGYTHA